MDTFRVIFTRLDEKNICLLLQSAVMCCSLISVQILNGSYERLGVMKMRAGYSKLLVCICVGLGAATVFFQPPQMLGDGATTLTTVSNPAAVDVSKIYGRIQIVKSFPDYKVEVVDSFPDLRVQVVNSFPDKPGKWEIVNSSPDFKIQFVDSFPDFKIKYVSSFPGSTTKIGNTQSGQ